MTAPTQAERLIVLETKMDIVISQQKDTNTKLDVLLPTFVTQTEFNQELSALKRRTWVQNTLSAIMGVVLTLLLTYFFSNITK
jgi:hypothetical protein